MTFSLRPGQLDDPELEAIRQAADDCDQVKLARLLVEHEHTAAYDLAGILIRDFWGRVDVAWMLETLYTARTLAREEHPEVERLRRALGVE